MRERLIGTGLLTTRQTVAVAKMLELGQVLRLSIIIQSYDEASQIISYLTGLITFHPMVALPWPIQFSD